MLVHADLALLLKSNDLAVRKAALCLVGLVGPLAARELRAALDDPRAEIRRVAVRGFWSLVPAEVESLAALTRRLEDVDWRVRVGSVIALGHQGKGAARSLKALFALKIDPHENVRRCAERAVHAIQWQLDR